MKNSRFNIHEQDNSTLIPNCNWMLKGKYISRMLHCNKYNVCCMKTGTILWLCVICCLSLFVLLSFFLWQLRCLSVDLRIPIHPLISSSSSCHKQSLILIFNYNHDLLSFMVKDRCVK